MARALLKQSIISIRFDDDDDPEFSRSHLVICNASISLLISQFEATFFTLPDTLFHVQNDVLDYTIPRLVILPFEYAFAGRRRSIRAFLNIWKICCPTFPVAGPQVVKPTANSSCHAGRNCTIDWLDDGSEPLLPAMGICTFGLYHGNQVCWPPATCDNKAECYIQKLVQSIPAVDVSRTLSVSFVVNTIMLFLQVRT